MNMIPINAQLKKQYPGPFGPRYWLIMGEDKTIVVRGWRLARTGLPMGDHLAVCATLDAALQWIENHSI